MTTGCERTHLHSAHQNFRFQQQQPLFHPDSALPSPFVPDLNTPESLTMSPFGEERKTKWWPVSRAAYGSVFQPTGNRDEFHQPFILPAMNPANGSFDNEMQTAISHFNYVLCRFYSQMILPFIYNCTGHLCRPGVRPGPIYVNPKQYHCILKRRIQRAKLMKSNRGLFVRKKYLHESRHRHATKRLRNAHGRFVSKAVKTEPTITTTMTASSD